MSTVGPPILGNGRSVPFYDGNLTVPVEIEGSGIPEVDPVTSALIIKRKYAQLKFAYQPPVPGFVPPVDYQYSGAIFISEKVTSSRGGLNFFDRIYATVPPPRTERRLIPFTYPGQSAAKFSGGNAIGWDPYGVAAPKTRRVAALVNFSYATTPAGMLQDPIVLAFPGLPSLSGLQLSQITYNGKLVDFVGPVYIAAGTAYLGNNRTSPLYVNAGTTTPADLSGFAGTPWLEAIELKRWMGQIWEASLTYIPAGGVF